MMFANAPGLGMIPDWQLSFDPAVNPKINPFVVYPDGMNQETTQPVRPVWGLDRSMQMGGVVDSASWLYDNRKLLAGVGLVAGGIALGLFLFR